MEIEGGAFSGCRSLSSIKLSKGLIKIGVYAFCSCEKLEEIVIPEGVTTIDRDAFNGCKELRRVVIPSTLCHLGLGGIFWGCYKLKKIYIPKHSTWLFADKFGDYDSKKLIEDYRYDPSFIIDSDI